MRRRHNISASSGKQQRRAALTVEFALVAPVIFAFFLGGLELTSLNLMRHTAGNASYEAARKAIVPGGTGKEAEQEALRLLRSVGATQGVSVSFTDHGSSVTVEITVPVRENAWALLRFTGDTVIRRSCTLSRGT